MLRQSLGFGKVIRSYALTRYSLFDIIWKPMSVVFTHTRLCNKNVGLSTVGLFISAGCSDRIPGAWVWGVFQGFLLPSNPTRNEFRPFLLLNFDKDARYYVEHWLCFSYISDRIIQSETVHGHGFKPL